MRYVLHALQVDQGAGAQTIMLQKLEKISTYRKTILFFIHSPKFVGMIMNDSENIFLHIIDPPNIQLLFYLFFCSKNTTFKFFTKRIHLRFLIGL